MTTRIIMVALLGFAVSSAGHAQKKGTTPEAPKPVVLMKTPLCATKKQQAATREMRRFVKIKEVRFIPSVLIVDADSVICNGTDLELRTLEVMAPERGPRYFDQKLAISCASVTWRSLGRQMIVSGPKLAPHPASVKAEPIVFDTQIHRIAQWACGDPFGTGPTFAGETAAIVEGGKRAEAMRNGY